MFTWDYQLPLKLLKVLLRSYEYYFGRIDVIFPHLVEFLRTGKSDGAIIVVSLPFC